MSCQWPISTNNMFKWKNIQKELAKKKSKEKNAKPKKMMKYILLTQLLPDRPLCNANGKPPI